MVAEMSHYFPGIIGFVLTLLMGQLMVLWLSYKFNKLPQLNNAKDTTKLIIKLSRLGTSMIVAPIMGVACQLQFAGRIWP
jgi:hypothetical protein